MIKHIIPGLCALFEVKAMLELLTGGSKEQKGSSSEWLCYVVVMMIDPHLALCLYILIWKLSTRSCTATGAPPSSKQCPRHAALQSNPTLLKSPPKGCLTLPCLLLRLLLYLSLASPTFPTFPAHLARFWCPVLAQMLGGTSR